VSDGKQKERDIARWLSSHPAWPYGPVVTARSVSGGLARGEDLLREGGAQLPVSIEIKAWKGRATFQRVATWLEQSHSQAAGRPYCVVHAIPNRQVRFADVYTPWDLSSPATGWWSTPLAFWVQQPVYAAGSEF